MRVLLVGSGGREHALAWALAASPLLRKLWAAPGNPGIAEVAECVPIGAEDVPRLVAFARANAVDLVVPGPEAPLVAGLTDALAEAGIRCCGPSAAAARLEGSKSFANELCDEAGIPTARWEAFDDADAAIDFIRRRGAPLVVKADGLAAGKGVVVAADGGGGRSRGHRDDARGGVRRGRRAAGDRGVPRRRGAVGVRAVRRHRCDLSRRRQGPQAGGRGRYRAEHRRHGCHFAAAGGDRGARGDGDGADRAPGAGGPRGAGRAVPGRAVRRADADLGRGQGDRVQRPLGRSGMSGAAAAPALRPAAGAAGGVRRRAGAVRFALEAARPRSRWCWRRAAIPARTRRGAR